MNTVCVVWTGVSPLIVHNGQTADPLNKFSKAIKEISSKRKKSDADYGEMARIEYTAALYLHPEKGVVMPADNILATIIGGAKLSKLGKQFASSLFIPESDIKLVYKGPTTPETLFANPNFIFVRPVKVGTSKVMRTRPIFREWSLEFELEFDSEVLNQREVAEAMDAAGLRVGLCEWRPRYGRFNVEISK
jgi:hypothetical protein